MDDSPNDDAAWPSLDAIASWERLRSQLTPPLRVLTLTPWGLTLGAALQRAYPFAEIRSGDALVSVAVLLPSGHGAQSARRRSMAIAAWFDAVHGPEWRAHGFGAAVAGGAEWVEWGGVRRWAVRLTMSAPQTDVAAWRWAAERERQER